MWGRGDGREWKKLGDEHSLGSESEDFAQWLVYVLSSVELLFYFCCHGFVGFCNGYGIFAFVQA